MTSAVRVPGSTHEALKELARESGKPMSEVLAQAVENYRRHVFLALAVAAYGASTAATPDDELWERTVADGLVD
ncbi:MAG TPA: toxin-antitoxin system protein [Candidatus Limnocylindria bacterium]|jgi:predicted transcriptional regulator